MPKKVGEIFSDYKTQSNIKEAEVKVLNVNKKKNILGIKIFSNQYIEIKEIWFLEKFLKERFEFSSIDMTIEYANQVKTKGIEEEWANIICYISHRYPLAKPMLLMKSKIKINENQIDVYVKIKGVEFLKAKKSDIEIENTIEKLFGKKYKINLIEDINANDINLLKEQAQKTQKRVIQKMMEENATLLENTQKNDDTPEKTNEIKENNKEKKQIQETNIDEEQTPLILGRNLNIKEQLVNIEDLTIDDGRVALSGDLLNFESRELKSGKTLLMFDLYDGTSTLTCKSFLQQEKAESVLKRIKKAKGLKIAGNAQFDQYAGEITVMANTIIETQGLAKKARMDLADEKRVELHMHTKMSQMDAMTSAKDLIKRAMKWGMKSIAITDHGVVQAFPEAHKLLGYDNPDMKVIYGVEAYLAPDKNAIVTNAKGQDIDTTYCVLDLETTGFSASTERITEIGVMKIKEGKVIEEFSTFVNPQKHIPERVTEVTNITDEMVADAPKIEEIFPKLLEFIKGTVLVAHNAPFDIGFLKQNAVRLGYEFDFTYLDTLSLAKSLFPEYKKYKLGKIADNLGIKVEVAHRALDDVDTTVKIFDVMMEMLKKRGAKKVEDIDIVSVDKEAKKEEYKKLKTYHAIILAKNYVGLKNLYKLVSYSHLDYFYRKPRILKSLYQKYSEGLILGSACEAGELYQAIELRKTRR